jgi:tetratricopeptide (TPR) repeat protein
MTMQGLMNIGRICLLSFVVVALCAATYARNFVWENEITLLEDAAAKSPNKGRVHHNLGRAYDVNRLPRKAFEQYVIATSVEPDFAKAHESLGISYMGMGRTDLARRQFEIALQLDSGLREASRFLAYIMNQHQ